MAALTGIAISQEKNLLFIGQVAALSGLPVKTIRYYADIGLLNSLARTEGGYRQFSSQVLTRLAFIKRCQSLGLSLQEIGDILKIYDQGELPCGDIKQKLSKKLLEIDHQIEQLTTLRGELSGLLLGWENPATQEGTICPILQKN